MISSLNGTNGIHVFNGFSHSGPYVNGDFSQMGPGVPGELRMLGNTTYVWNNNCWTVVSSSGTTVELTVEVQQILEWARRAMVRDKEIEKLAKEYPAVKSAKENLDVIVALTRDIQE